MTTKNLLTLSFMIGILSSCNQPKSIETNIEQEIAGLVKKFPQLPKGPFEQTDYYKLVRSVRNGEKNFEIQLRSAPDSLEDPQQIIVLANQAGKCRAIPFFSNTYRDYWQFQFDKKIPQVKAVNTTFEKEFMNALNVLQLNDTVGTGNAVVTEMLYSLLHCVKVTESDSAKLFTLRMTDNHDVPDETSDSAYVRLGKNYQAISSVWHPKEYITNYNSYLDEKGGRVYMIEHKEKNWRKKMNLKITVYRQDCIYHSFTI